MYPDSVVLEHKACPLGCQEADEFVLSGNDMINGLAGTFSIYKCRVCGLERTNPRPTAQTIGVYYPETYGPYNIKESRRRNSLVARGAEALKSVLRLESRVLPRVSIGRMLEVGCSTGEYMESARRCGWVVEGIEFSEKAASVARERGFVVRGGSVEDMVADPHSYDLIVGWMVLEHLHEPVLVLKKLRCWVKPDGYLVISVPTAKSLVRKVFGKYCYDLHLPNHLYHFTPDTLDLLMRSAGWRIERVRWQISCSTLLSSMHNVAVVHELRALSRFTRWLRYSWLMRPIRALLGLFLGMTRQSGRIEVWARPI
jgi:SAM-dependent methyltransferase